MDHAASALLNHLQTSADGFLWAFEQLPSHYYLQLPPAPGYLGTWPPLRHLWHVQQYELRFVIPSMRQWLDEPMPGPDAWDDSDGAWTAAQHTPFEALAQAFRAVREQQHRLIEELAPRSWYLPRVTAWGEKPLSMVVTKTLQHTWEHGDTIMRMGLWWDDARERERAQQRAGAVA